MPVYLGMCLVSVVVASVSCESFLYAETPAQIPALTLGPEADRPSQNDALTPEERAELEAALASDSESETPPPVSQSLLDVALILDVAAAYFSQEPDQLGAHDPNQTGFTFQQLELSVGANVDPYFRFDANLVFSLFGVEIEEAYASTLDLPLNLKLRAGQFLTPFGRLNPTHPHAWKFVDQPLVNGKFFGGEGSRGLGVEVSWLSPLPWFLETVASVNNATGECCARSFLGGEQSSVEHIGDLLYTLSVKQLVPFSESTALQIGLSAQFGPNASGFRNRTEIYGADLYLKYRPSSAQRMSLTWTAEGMFRTRQIPRGVLQDFGGYSEVVWAISPRWETGGRYEFVSGVDNDPIDPEWDVARQRGAVQISFLPTHFSRIRLQPTLDSIPNRSLLAGVMLNFELVAGAHGSHDY